MEQAPRPSRTGEALLTVKEVAEHLRVSINTVHRLAETGALPSHRVGRLRRFRPAAVEAYLNSDAVAESTSPRPLRSA